MTFRLADSLPRAFADQWYRERRQWLAAHGINISSDAWHQALRDLPGEVQQEFHDKFTLQMESKLDEGHGLCWLRHDNLRATVSETMLYHHGSRYWLGSYVIMPNHVHALVTPYGDRGLDRVCYTWKNYSAKAMNKLMGRRGTVWQSESFDHIVRSERHLDRFAAYIEKNPKEAGLKRGVTQGRGLQRKLP